MLVCLCLCLCKCSLLNTWKGVCRFRFTTFITSSWSLAVMVILTSAITFLYLYHEKVATHWLVYDSLHSGDVRVLAWMCYFCAREMCADEWWCMLRVLRACACVDVFTYCACKLCADICLCFVCFQILCVVIFHRTQCNVRVLAYGLCVTSSFVSSSSSESGRSSNESSTSPYWTVQEKTRELQW